MAWMAQVGSQPGTGYPAHLGRGDLDADHQRRREQGGPQEAEAVLRTGLGVRGDATGVVVCSAGNQARPQRTQGGAQALARRAGTKRTQRYMPGRRAFSCVVVARLHRARGC
jgi:hypothetical protein